MPTIKPKQSAHKQKLCDDLRNHLIGHHGLTYREVGRLTYAALLQKHSEVKEKEGGPRWCKKIDPRRSS